jgi:hypothetical protein
MMRRSCGSIPRRPLQQRRFVDHRHPQFPSFVQLAAGLLARHHEGGFLGYAAGNAPPRLLDERGRFPAINVLKSISRTMPACQSMRERAIVTDARQTLSAYANMEELIRIGAYRTGADPQIDRAIALNPALEGFLGQDKDEVTDLDTSFNRLADILGLDAE